MSPLRPTGSWGTTTSDSLTQTLPLVDEWGDQHLPTREARMARDECREALDRLDEVPDLLGHIPAEVNAILKTVIHRRDGASMAILRWLRALDGAARGDLS